MNLLKAEKPLLVIAGPTAAGKSAAAIAVAKKINGEIISADSMQVYKHMDIGTAKVSKEELSEVRHHLIDVFPPSFDFSVAVFKDMAKKAALDIIARGKIPIVTGGTGFYINALIYDNDFINNEDSKKDYAYRNHLANLALEKGNESVYNMLLEIDPVSAEHIHPNNIKRVIRALELYHETGIKMSDHNTMEKNRKPFFDCFMVVLHMDRDILYERINRRVDKMIENGLIEEVKSLLEKGYTRDMVSMQGLGYKEIVKYLMGEYSLSEAVEILKRDTRHFAKRQITWFKHQAEALWLNVNDFSDTECLAEEIMKSCL